MVMPAKGSCRSVHASASLRPPCIVSGILGPMLELLIVAGSLGLIGLIGLVTVMVTPPMMVEYGLWTLAAGLVIGIPTGWWYHVVLYRTLAGRMPMPSQWWRKPVALHPLLTADEYPRIRRWFVAGALGFVLCVSGGLAAMAGLLVLRWYP